jgi:hypothetical protein
MYGIEQITEYSFKNPELLAKIKAEAQDLVEHLSAPEACKMAMELEQKIKELAALEVREPQVFAQYQQILIRLKFLSIAYWSEEIYFELIKNNLADILGSDIDILDRMTGKFYMVPLMVWPEYAQATIEVLRQNIQPIGSRLLAIPGEQRTHPPLIKYWLMDYDHLLGLERHENIERAKYFTDSRNFQSLSEQDKIKIQQLLEFYDGLKPLPLPEEEIPEREEGEILIAVPRQRGEEGDFGSREEEIPEYPVVENEPSTSVYQPPSAPPKQPAQVPGGLPTQQPAPQTPPPQQKDTYREQVASQDLAGPQAAQRPAPKLNGNVINLKEMGNNQ